MKVFIKNIHGEWIVFTSNGDVFIARDYEDAVNKKESLEKQNT